MKLNMGSLRSSFGQGGFILLCIAALAFPFSVAVTNIALAVALFTGIISGDFARGLSFMWSRQRWLSIAWLAYLALFPLGLLWSLDVDRGLQIIGRQWFWLLLPLAAHIFIQPARRKTFIQLLSISLSMHLLFCLAQFYGLIAFGKPGSSADNPTGHIGHTSFGFVYGLWAALLIQQSLFLQNWQRWALRAVALWAVGMVFLASGRGGYLVVAALLLVSLWKLARLRSGFKLAAGILIILGITAALSIGPGKERMMTTWQSIKAIQHGNFQHSETRWSLWYIAIESWRQHMPLGVGTGGYHIAAKHIKAQKPELSLEGNNAPAHPHNMLLQSFSRWGPAGVFLLAALFIIWIREGWREDWHTNASSSLLGLTGIALFVQGLSEPSFEEHFPGILAVLLCAIGLASISNKPFNSCPDDAQSNASCTDE